MVQPDRMPNLVQRNPIEVGLPPRPCAIESDVARIGAYGSDERAGISASVATGTRCFPGQSSFHRSGAPTFIVAELIQKN